jgi:gliding motility-associated-like protein
VFIPNAFTPNQIGPGLNNKFYVIADGIISSEIRIYNRWGEQMYISENLKEGWDGKFGGKECQQDVYAYLLRVRGFDGKLYEYSGTITLLR